MFDIGGPEFLMILVGVLILFGPKKLPELAQTLGKGLRQFRRAQQEFNDQITSAMREEERAQSDAWSRPINPKTVARGTSEARETPELALGTGSEEEEEKETNDIAAGIPREAIEKAEEKKDEERESGREQNTDTEDTPNRERRGR